MPTAAPMKRSEERIGALLATHQRKPLSVQRFADLDLKLPPLFPRQAAFLQRVFPDPVTVETPIFNPDIREAVALWGKGSGKDTIAALAQLYVTYRLELHPDPQAWLGLAPDTNIDLINVASDAMQAKTVFFELVKSFLARSFFFTRLLRGFEAGRDVQSNIIVFPRHVRAHSLHSVPKSAEGKNTFFAVMDEADAFRDVDTGANNADDMHHTLLSSMGSRFPKNHLLLVLSWPRHQESFTIRRYEAGTRGAQGVYADRGATWDIRTDRKREDFAADYERDPEGSRATFETLPPATEDAFFSMPEKLELAYSGVELVSWEPGLEVVQGQSYRVLNVLGCNAPPEGASDYWLHMDAGLSGDSYALAMTRGSGRRRIVEALLVWKPGHGAPVYFPNVLDTILKLRTHYRIRGASFDRWNSAESIQRLNAVGLFAEAMTFSQPEQLAMYENLKTLVYAGDLVLPKTGLAVETLKRELRRLQLLKGRKVDHPPGESKDIADAVAASCLRAEEFHEPAPMKGEVAIAEQPEAFKSQEGFGGFNHSLLDKQW